MFNSLLQGQTQNIISKFQKNRHFLSPAALTMVVDYISQKQQNKSALQDLIRKINQMTIRQNSSLNEKMLKRAIDLLNYSEKHNCMDLETTDDRVKTQPITTYQQLNKQLYSWSTLYISPYQYAPNKFFVSRPDKSLFKFEPEDKVSMYMKRFKKIRDYNKPFYKGNSFFIGVLFQKFSMKYGTTQLVLQDQIAEIVINFQKNKEVDLFLIPGCTYIVKGYLQELSMVVQQIMLPKPLPLTDKENLLKLKFDAVCKDINQIKDSLEFEARDFINYDCIYNEKKQKNKPIIIFGNITINKRTVQRIYYIISQFPKGVECIILVLSNQRHDQIDLSVWFKGHQLYLIPHVNSEGPRILPKIPVLRHQFQCKILSNPARISIHGKQCIFINYPLVKNLYAKNLIPKQVLQINKQEMMRKISDFVFSQNNVAISNDTFWKQSDYMDINAESLLFIYDNACPHIQLKNKNGGGIVSVGDFQRDRQFISFFPKFEEGIQFCQDSSD